MIRVGPDPKQAVGLLVTPDGVQLQIAFGGNGGRAPDAPVQTITVMAGEELSMSRAVWLGVDGLARYAGPSTPNGSCIFITRTGAPVNTPVELWTNASLVVEPTWGWTPGRKIFVTNNGILTQTPPTSGTVFAVGFATSPTAMQLHNLQAVTLALS